MTVKTILLPVAKADFVVGHCHEYGVEMVKYENKNIGSVRLTVSGADENVKRLFNEIGE